MWTIKLSRPGTIPGDKTRHVIRTVVGTVDRWSRVSWAMIDTVVGGL